MADSRRSSNVSSVAGPQKAAHDVVVVVVVVAVVAAVVAVVAVVDSDASMDEAGCSHWSQPVASQSRAA